MVVVAVFGEPPEDKERVQVWIKGKRAHNEPSDVFIDVWDAEVDEVINIIMETLREHYGEANE